MMTSITRDQATQLLHNKYVVILGDSVQRCVYKDLVLLLQRDEHLSLSQLKTKGELSFERDCLVEGGQLAHMNNGTEYREARQYCTDHHLIRFYFLTRIFSKYMKRILEDFQRGPEPDVIVINSCVWDISRYGSRSFEQYKENLHVFFREIKNNVPPKCLILWNMAMPLGRKIKGGFLVPEVSHMAPSLRHDVIEANFYSSEIANAYDADVLDLHYNFRLSLQHRAADGVHWDALAHRRISGLLLHHIADAWGVELNEPTSTSTQGAGMQALSTLGPIRRRPESSGPRPLQVTLQRCPPIQYHQSNFRSDRYQPCHRPHYGMQAYSNMGPIRRRPESSGPRPLQVTLQRCPPVQYHQSNFRSDRYQPYHRPHYGDRHSRPWNRSVEQPYRHNR